MTEKPARFRNLFVAAIVFAIVLATRAVFLLSPTAGAPLLPDELEMTRSSLDRFLGVPSTALAWPGGTMQMLSVPAIGAQFAVESGGRPSPAALVRFLSETYRDPGRTLIVLRLLVAALFALAVCRLSVSLAARAGDWMLPVLFALSLATAPFVWFYSHVALGDGVALALAVAAIGCLLATPEKATSYVVAGILLGLAVASKIVIVMIFPLAYAYAVARTDRSVRRVAVFVVAQAVGFLLGCPYLWTDPLRLAKSIGGNLTRTGEPAGLVGGLAFIEAHAVPFYLAALVALAGVFAIRRRDWLPTIGIGLTVLLSVVVAARGKVLGAQYFVPLTAACWIFIAYQGSATVAAKGARVRRIAAAVVLVAAIAANGIGYAGLRSRSTAAQRDLGEMIRDLRQRSALGEPVALPYAMHAATSRELSVLPVTPFLSRASLLHLAETVGAAADSLTRNPAFGAGLGLSVDAARAIAGAFDEDERALVARSLAMAITAPEGGINAWFWTDENAERLGLMTRRDAEDALARGAVDRLLTDAPLPDRRPARVYATGLYLYEADRNPSVPD